MPEKTLEMLEKHLEKSAQLPGCRRRSTDVGENSGDAGATSGEVGAAPGMPA
jgi:hypothetical protein